MAEQWLSIVEYARTFNVSDMTVRRRIKTGKLHAVLKDGKYYIPTSAAAEGGKKALVQAESDEMSQLGKYRYDAAPQMPASRTQSSEMQVVKGHPAAAKTIVPPQEAPRAQQSYLPQHAQPHQSIERDEARYSAVPTTLMAPLVANDRSLVDTRALLAYCDATLKKMNDMERRTVERFKAKLDAVESTLQLRDSEIRALKQQVEDLQVLVGILEKKNMR